MENLDLLSNDLQVTPQAQSYLTESAKWGKFLAIVGFIFCGFLLAFAFIIPALLTEMTQNSANEIVFNDSMNVYVRTIYIVLSVAYFFPYLYLFRFSDKMRLAVKNVSQEEFEKSLMNLKAMFKFFGIFTIVSLSIVLLITTITIIALAMNV